MWVLTSWGIGECFVRYSVAALLNDDVPTKKPHLAQTQPFPGNAKGAFTEPFGYAVYK